VPNNCVLAIYGDIQVKQVVAAVKKAFVRWTPNNALRSLDRIGVEQSALRNGSSRGVETRDKKQAVLVMGFPGSTLLDEDRLRFGADSGVVQRPGFSPVPAHTREARAGLLCRRAKFPGLTPGYFAFYCGTAPDKVESVEQELLREAELLRAEGLTEEELRRAKAKVIGQKKIARQTSAISPSPTALDELYGLGYANVDAEDAKFEAVTREQIKAAAQKYLRPDASSSPW